MNLWKNILKIGEKQNFKELWKYGSIMANKKTLIIILLWFLKENFHINFYNCMLHHILDHYK
jgi:hypothetical protein